MPRPLLTTALLLVCILSFSAADAKKYEVTIADMKFDPSSIEIKVGDSVEWIGGDYTNVVGLPLALTGRMLANAGIPHP